MLSAMTVRGTLESMPEFLANDLKRWPGGDRTLVLFAWEDEKASALIGLPRGSNSKALTALAKEEGFKGKERSVITLRPEDANPAKRLLGVGLGKRKDYTIDTLRKAAGTMAKAAEQKGLTELEVRLPEIARSAGLAQEAQAVVEGIVLGTYRFEKHRKPDPDAQRLARVELWANGNTPAMQKGVDRGVLYGQAVILTRDLVNEPPSVMNPVRMEQEAKKLAGRGVSVEVFDTKQLEKLGMNAILGVGAGGAVPPRLIHLHYKPATKAKKKIALVGKGITFDSGGLSLKPSNNMETMKMDMAGAAAILGIFKVLPDLKLPVEVEGLLATAENMPSGRAIKPGDVLKAYNGKTIEVLNTDAEGRLVLSDALSYACDKLKPDAVIDIATLTGACIIALGSAVSGVMGNNPRLLRDLQTAAEKSSEKFWELPLVKEYAEEIKSKVADIKNIAGKREAGAIIGGLFLQEFVDSAAWAHLDIAGPAWADSDLPYAPTGATGHPVRTLLHYLEGIR